MTGQPARVLVVDDDDSIRMMIHATLARSGYEVREARNGREALAEMGNAGIDLVVLDLMMPVMSGWDLLAVRATRPELRRIPVIVATANAVLTFDETVRRQICAFLPKPFELDELHGMVSSCLRQGAGF